MRGNMKNGSIINSTSNKDDGLSDDEEFDGALGKICLDGKCLV